MKAPSHITASLTFTGVLCSIYDINIFSSYTGVLLCAGCAVLPDNTNFINLKNKYNFHITAITDTATQRNRELAELLAAQEEEQRRYRRNLQEYNKYIADVQNIENTLQTATLSNYERNRLQNELIRLRNQRKERPTYEPSIRTQVRIDELRKSIDDRLLQFSGYLTIYQIVDPSLPEVREQFREIDPTLTASAQKRKSVFAN